MTLYPVAIMAARTDMEAMRRMTFVSVFMVEARSVAEANGLAMPIALKRYPITKGFADHFVWAAEPEVKTLETARIWAGEDAAK